MRQVWLIVRREFCEKVRSRVFIGTNIFLLLLVVAAVALPALLSDDGPDVVRVATVGDQPAAVAEAASQQAPSLDYRLEVAALDDEQTAREQLDAGELDVALLPDGRLLSQESPANDLVRLFDGASRTLTLDGALAEAGVDSQRRTELLAGEPLAVDVLAAGGQDEGPDPGTLIVGLAMVFTLYGVLIFYGQQVAQGLVQEKQSRVIEVLLASVRPIHLLGGKLLGLGLLGLVQIALLAGVGAAGVLLTDQAEVSAVALPTIVAGVLWFIGGYALYATLFALTAALVPRIEDLQSSMFVPIILLVGSLFVAQFAVADPDGALARIGGLVPTVAPIYQPLSVALGTASPVTMGFAAFGVVVTVAVLVPLTARVHAGAALATRNRLSIGEALRRSRD